MKKSSVAITLTTVTAIMSFGVGGGSQLKGLSSLCIFSAVGILFLYFHMCTFFLAFLAIDEKRIRENKNLFYQTMPTDWEPNEFSTKAVLETAFRKYADLLLTAPGKTLTMKLTLAFIFFGVLIGVSRQKVDMDVTAFFETDSEIRLFIQKQQVMMKGYKSPGFVYLVKIDDIYDHLEEINDFVTNVSMIIDPNDDDAVKSFLPSLIDFIGNDRLNDMTDESFADSLSEFLFSIKGYPYFDSFFFENNTKPKCGEPAPELYYIRIPYRQK